MSRACSGAGVGLVSQALAIVKISQFFSQAWGDCEIHKLYEYVKEWEKNIKEIHNIKLRTVNVVIKKLNEKEKTI